MTKRNWTAQWLDKIERGLPPEKIDLLYQAALEIYIGGVESGHYGRNPDDEENVKGARRETYRYLQSKTKNKVHIPLYIK